MLTTRGIFKQIPARYVLCAMCYTGIALQYTIKVSLSVAIVAMVRQSSANNTSSQPNRTPVVELGNNTSQVDVCPGGDDNLMTHSQNGEFDWNARTQGYVLSAYFYGYVATQLLGGRLSEVLGSKVIIGPGVLISGILSLLCPFAARLDVGSFIFVRALIGASSGVIIPSTHVIFSKWYPLHERTSLGGLIMSSVPMGTIISLSLSGILAELGGWPLIFYFFGGISVLWFIPWMFLVYDTPEKHPFILNEEKVTILRNRGYQDINDGNVAVPWLAILTSLPVWANAIMAAGCSWFFMTLLIELPTYLTNILHYNIKTSGAMSALPYLVGAFCEVGFSFLSQWMQTKRCVTKLTAYHIFNTISTVGCTGFLLMVTRVGCDSTATLILLILSVASSSSYSGGSMMNHLDIGSNFAGTLAGMLHTFSNIAGIISPIVTGHIIDGHESLTQWHIVFYVTIVIKVITYLAFLTFGSAESEPWNKPLRSARNEGKPLL